MTAIKAGDSINAQLATIICGFDEKTLSDLAVKNAVSAILDTLAVTAAGRAEQTVMSLQTSLPVYASASSAQHKVWREDDAALLLGTASHALDYDDVSMVTVCHPSAPVLSSLCAAICFGNQPLKRSGRELIAALCVGTEVLIRIGQAMGFRHVGL